MEDGQIDDLRVAEKELETASAELTAARQKFEEAERDVEQAARHVQEAERDLARAIEKERHPRPFKVTVIYNGVEKHFEVRPKELVQRLLEQARSSFGPITNPHLLGLFTKAGVELNDNQTIEAAGLKPHEVLLLRPSSVRGG